MAGFSAEGLVLPGQFHTLPRPDRYQPSTLGRDAAVKFKAFSDNEVAPYSATPLEIRECTFDELFDLSTENLGGPEKLFIRVIRIPTATGVTAYVAKRYKTEFKEYTGPLSKKRFIASFDPEFRDLIAASIEAAGVVGIPGVLDPCLQKFKPPEELAAAGERYKPKGAYVCDIQFHEFLIGMYINQLLKDRRTIHLPRTYNILACNQHPDVFNYYILIELLKNVQPIYDVDDYGDDVMLQALHTVHLLHYIYKMSHNDLHGNNVMLQRVTDNLTVDGKRLVDYAFWEYRVMGHSFYIPRSRWCVKIIDFGLTCKYTDPQLAYDYVAIEHTTVKNIIPYRFTPATDLLMLLDSLTRPRNEQATSARNPAKPSMWSNIYSYLQTTAEVVGVVNPDTDRMLAPSLSLEGKHEIARKLYSYIYGRNMTIADINRLYIAPQAEERTETGKLKYTPGEIKKFQDALAVHVPVEKFPDRPGRTCPSVASVILYSHVFDRFMRKPHPSEGAIILIGDDGYTE